MRDNNIKVLSINSVYNTGSTGKIVASIHMELIENGYSSIVAYGRGSRSDEPYTYRIGSRFEVILHVAHTRLFGTVGHGSIFGTLALLRLMDDYNPDIVHLHNIHGYYVNIYLLMQYFYRRNMPVVWTLHDNWVFTGRCGSYYDCKKWVTGCGNCTRLGEYPATKFFDRSAGEWRRKRNAIAALPRLVLVSPSQWLAKDVRISFLANKKTEVIPNGIDTTRLFYPRKRIIVRNKMGITDNQIVVLAIAPDFSDDCKGGRYVVDFARAVEKDNLKVLIVGWKSEKDGLPGNVIALPPTKNQSQLAEYYSTADVLIITSLSENFPTVGLESLACGTPVIGFNVGGIPEQASGRCGLCVPPRDVKALREGVLRIVSERDYFSREYCRNIAVTNYDQRVMVKRYMSIYRQLLNTNGSKLSQKIFNEQE